MPTLSSLLTPLLPLTQQVIGFIEQGLQQAPDSRSLKEARGALGRLTLLAQVEEDHDQHAVTRLLKHAQDHLLALDQASLGQLLVSDEPVLAVRTLYAQLQALTIQQVPTARKVLTEVMPSDPAQAVDDYMLQAACDAYAQHNESVGESGEYFPDAMKAALEAAMKVQAQQNWIRRMAALEEKAGGETTAGIPFALQFISHPQGDSQ